MQAAEPPATAGCVDPRLQGLSGARSWDLRPMDRTTVRILLFRGRGPDAAWGRGTEHRTP